MYASRAQEFGHFNRPQSCRECFGHWKRGLASSYLELQYRLDQLLDLPPSSHLLKCIPHLIEKTYGGPPSVLPLPSSIRFLFSLPRPPSQTSLVISFFWFLVCYFSLIRPCSCCTNAPVYIHRKTSKMNVANFPCRQTRHSSVLNSPKIQYYGTIKVLDDPEFY